MDHIDTPSLEQIRHELRARLLADTLRSFTIFGDRALALAGKSPEAPRGLVTPPLDHVLGRAPLEPSLEDIELAALPVGKTVDAMYDYAFSARHPLGMTPNHFSDEVEAVEDFVLSFKSDLFDLFLRDPIHSQGAPQGALESLCLHTRARLYFDKGEMLHLDQVALLAGLNERSVRNATSAADPQQRLHASDDFVENTEARRWLRSKRSFKPTVFPEVSEVPGEHPNVISNLQDLGRYLDVRWQGLGKSLDDVVAELGWDKQKAAYLRALPAEPQLLDPRDCEAIAGTLLVSPAWLVKQVMQLKYPRQVELLLQASAMSSLLPARGSLDPEVGDAAMLSTRLVFVLHDGTRLFPCRMKNRLTKRVAFRLSPGGTGGNTLEAGEEVEDEDRMIDLVVNHGYAVRMASERGGMKSLYKLAGRAVSHAFLDGKQVGAT
ncbi:MAG: hypothetical protein Q8L49_09280 [Burkholderiaceae bacterium]|nr:hypothetical protein [Burkholderiaceae bacterium]